MNEKIYDLKQIEEVCARDSDSFRKIIHTFINSATDAMAKIQQLAPSGDWAAIASIAHQLISGFGYVGAKPLQELAREIEKDAQDRHLTDIKEKTNRLLNNGTLLINVLKADLKMS
ncbi:MAG: Hpt domain-containing protein [Bacteroidales bacterium]|nr:Hpt domain-containing protein [Bacteroidales bacterium]